MDRDPNPPDLPKRITLEDLGDGVVIRRRWINWSVLFLILFCAFWDGIVLVFVGTGIAGIIQGKPDAWMMLLFITGHLAVGVGMTYYTLAILVNTTTIAINSAELSIRHGPLKWPGNRTLDPAQVKQLFVERKVHRNKNGVSYSFQVHAILLDDQRVKLLSGLPSFDQAQFLERAMERFMAIQDAPVAGEHRSL